MSCEPELMLVRELAQPPKKYDFDLAQTLIAEIREQITDWPRQWKRELSQRGVEPFWKLAPGSLKRIQELGSNIPDGMLGPMIDGRIVICELLNIFRPMAFPNPLELHGSLRYGIRPLLYSVLRREFFSLRNAAVCAHHLLFCRGVSRRAAHEYAAV